MENDLQQDLSGIDNVFSSQQIKKQQQQLNTLDEDISTSLKRDLMIILSKTKTAMLPMNANTTSTQFKDWDFWGPLLFCMLLGLTLSIGRNDNQPGVVFILVFVIVWLGALIISLNSQFLGVKLTICQCICIIGYCMCAIVITAIITSILPFLPTFMNFALAMCGFIYSSYCKCYIHIYIYITLLLNSVCCVRKSND